MNMKKEISAEGPEEKKTTGQYDATMDGSAPRTQAA